MADTPLRYHGITVALHWLMALSFFVMLTSGFVMSNAESLEPSIKFKLYQWHKSGGVLLLLAFFVRLGMRLWRAAPILPASFKKLDIVAAKWGHWGLYGLMIAMPVTGWVIVSSSGYGLPTLVFNWFEWPHIPGLAGNKMLRSIAGQAHLILAFVFAFMIAAHVAAVVKHALKDKVNLLPRMWWGR